MSGENQRRTKAFLFDDVPMEIHSAFKMYCDSRGVAMKDVAIELIINFLRENKRLIRPVG